MFPQPSLGMNIMLCPNHHNKINPQVSVYRHSLQIPVGRGREGEREREREEERKEEKRKCKQM